MEGMIRVLENAHYGRDGSSNEEGSCQGGMWGGIQVWILNRSTNANARTCPSQQKWKQSYLTIVLEADPEKRSVELTGRRCGSGFGPGASGGQ